MRLEFPFKPTWLQWQVMVDNHRFKTVVAARRCGKTYMGVNLLVYYGLRYPGIYWFCAPTYGMAKKNAWDEMKRLKYIPEELIEYMNETDMTVKLITGSLIRFVGVDNRESLRGSGLSGVILDEYQDMDADLFSLVIRPMLSDFKGFAIFIGTPKSRQNVLYMEYIKDKDVEDKEFRTEEDKPIETHREYKSFHFETIDNPYISEDEIEAARASMTEDHFDQEYRAKFVNYTGLIFKEFNEQKHVREIGAINKDNIYVGIDTGEYTAVEFCALSSDGKWRIFDEIYAVDQTVNVVCDLIKKRLLEYNLSPDKVQFIIDSASQHKREYMAQGIYVVDCEKDTLGQIDKMRDMFKRGEIAIANKCNNLINQLKTYIWDERKTKKKGRQPKKVADHSIDGLRYVIGSSFIAKPFERKGSTSEVSTEDINRIADRLGVLSDDFEKFEDENQLEYAGGAWFNGPIGGRDTVCGY